MAKPLRERCPDLAEIWDEYDHQIKFDDLFDAKWRSNGMYVALAWKEADGMISYADMAFGRSWEILNDLCDTITEKQWQSAKPDHYLDMLNYPEE